MAQLKTKSENYENLGGINSKASQYNTSQHEFLDLVNYDFQRPGAITKRPGSSFYIGHTVVGRITGLYEFERLNGYSTIIFTANTNAYTQNDSSAGSVFKTSLTSGALFDFSTFVDRLFMANGSQYFKYDGTNTSNYSLPEGEQSYGFSSLATGSLTGSFVIAYGYFNDRGYFGPCSTHQIVSASGSIMFNGLTTPAGFGISGMAFYRSSAGGVDLFRVLTVGGATTNVTIDHTNTLSSIPCPDFLYFTLIPRYLSIYNNQLFMSGFSSMLSTVWFSEIGEPEGVLPESSLEARTNDGDRIMALAPYNGVLMIFKERSFHKLTGDNPNNFTLSEVSDQYGCLSNRAVVVWEDFLWFLDRKGVVEYNGANVKIVSNKIEPYLQRMNVDSAKENAVAVHDRLNNKVKFSIPVDGATQNNLTLVYDYLTGAWTTESGYKPSSAAVIRGRLSQPTVMYGGYTGTLHYFGATFFGDNGAGMTTIAKTRFLADLGHSVEKEFRRLFLDVVPQGVTSAITCNFYQDYGASIVLSRDIYQSPFQTRIDFGIPAKAIAVEFTNTSNTAPIQINGYSIEFRELRRV